ncbi:Tetracycline resistance protein, class C [Cyberlindnera fabianii]|uniref:Tetracycline resistance protein, class C n=1 Tax=Cyberlindnera fabianii TaxID=36022 RepID=A0A1V2LF14_CYBFA|nr:Tetracycline resistance protein, class C [Cyberlindnera fabianii]
MTSIEPEQMKPQLTEHTVLLDPPSSSEQAIDDYDYEDNDNEDSDNEDDIRQVLDDHRAHHLTLAWHARPTVGIICFSVLIYFMQESVGLSSSVVLLLRMLCKYSQSNDDSISTCSDPKVQVFVSSVQMRMLLLGGALSCAMSGKLGGLSDRIGRRKVLIYCGVCSLMGRLFLLYIVRPNATYSPLLIIFAAIFNGLAGGNVVLLSLASSYITDIVESKKRTRALGFVMGSFYAGMGAGPLLGSYIVRATGDPRLSLWTGVGFASLFLLLMIFIAESRPTLLRTRSQSMHLARKASFASQRSGAHSIAHRAAYSVVDVFKPLKLLWLPRHKTLGFTPRFNVMMLVLVECCLFFTGVSMGGVVVLYSTANYNLTSEMLGYYISLVGTSKTIVLYTVSPACLYLLKRLFNQHTHAPDWIDFCLLLFGSINELLSPFIVYKSGSMAGVYASAIFGALGAFVTPTVCSTIMKYYSDGKSGEVFGALSLLKNILAMIGPSAGLFIYSCTVSYDPKFVFLFMAGIVCIGIIASICLRIHEDASITGFIKPRTSSISSLGDEAADSVPASPMRVYDAVRRGSAGGVSPRDPVSF